MVLPQDLRYAWRGLRRSPWFTAVAVASLALGIGANTAIFTLMNAVMFRLLPVQRPGELVELLQKYPGEPRGNGYWSGNSYRHLRDHNSVFSALIGTSVDHLARVSATGIAPQITVAEAVTGNYFSVLGIKPALGRLLEPSDDPAAGAPRVAVLSWSRWTNQFDANRNILGHRIFVEDQPATVVGVAPRNFVGLRTEAATDVWIPRDPSQQWSMGLVARLKPGATLAQARAEMTVLYRFTIEERAARSKDPLVRQLKVEVERAGAGLSTVRDRFARPLVVLMSLVGLLLLAACVNMASLLLARATGREREMAVRVGLGASRRRLVSLVLTESILLSTLGTLAGIVFAWFATGLLASVLASGRPHEQVHLRLQPDLHVLLFTAGIAALTGLLFGAAPALNAMRASPALALRQTGSTGETRVKRLFGQALVAAQIALSILLLSSAGLFIVHLWRLEHIDLGFRRDHVLLVDLDPLSDDSAGRLLAREYPSLHETLAHIPGVRSVSLCSPTPLSGAGASGFASVSGFLERPSDRRWISISYIAPHYFETFGSPLLAGRDFNSHDAAQPRLAILNQQMAHHYFQGRNPVGQTVTLEHVTGGGPPQTYQIVGVAGNAHYLDIREPVHSAIYLFGFRDGMAEARSFAVRTDIDPESVARDVRKAISGTLKTVAVARVLTLRDQVNSSIVPERLIATLSGSFAGLGALLAGIGLYGLLAYTVARRTKEIGVRMAIGATPRDVVLMVVRDALAIVAAGLALGIPLALAARAPASRLVTDIGAERIGPLAIAALLLLSGALLASYLPARRAATVDPIEALRHE